MRDDERDEAVKSHIAALDAEIARLRKMEQALDRRLAEQGGQEPPARSGEPEGGEDPDR